jgi:hypothetical protein
MMLKTAATALLTFVALVSIPTTTKASPIALEFDGVILDFPDGAATPFQGGVFRLVFAFELNTPDDNPGDPASGNYFDAITAGYLTIDTASESFRWNIDPAKPNTNIISIHNDVSGGDFYEAGPGLVGQSIPGLGSPTYLLVQLWDDDSTVFSNDSLPAVPDLAEFDRTNLQLTFGSCCASLGQVTRINQVPLAQAVPEPASITLCALAAGFCFLKRRRR